MFHRETPNPISLNQRVLGSSPSASTIHTTSIHITRYLRVSGLQFPICLGCHSGMYPPISMSG